MENGNQTIAPCTITRYVNGDEIKETFNGLTKREYFAAMALSGYMSIHSNQGSHNMVGGKEFDAKTAAECAVAYADALLAELEKPRQ